MSELVTGLIVGSLFSSFVHIAVAYFQACGHDRTQETQRIWQGMLLLEKRLNSIDPVRDGK